MTRKRIMRVGEQLFARTGIESTSMRMVALAAGQSNVAAVQYHFGSKDGLIGAIFYDRVEQMEAPREAILAPIGDLSDASMRQLLEMVHRPYLDLTDENGDHVYARMLLDYLSRYGRFMLPHPARDITGTTFLINRILLELEGRLDAAGITGDRAPYMMMVIGVLGAINDHDLRRQKGIAVRPISELLDELLDFMAGALCPEG